MSYVPGCGCFNYWNTPRSVCGTWDEPTVHDKGRCAPYRVKIPCEAPTVPTVECGDTEYETVYDPTNVDHPFTVIARVFDNNCEAILDSDGESILTTIY